MSVIYILLISLFIIITNYIALVYGMKIGKALQQEEVPEQPFKKPIEKIKLKAVNVIGSISNNVYRKKEEKKGQETLSIWD